MRQTEAKPESSYIKIHAVERKTKSAWPGTTKSVQSQKEQNTEKQKKIEIKKEKGGINGGKTKPTKTTLIADTMTSRDEGGRIGSPGVLKSRAGRMLG